MKSTAWEAYIKAFCRESGVRLVTNTNKTAANLETKTIYCPISEPERVNLNIPTTSMSLDEIRETLGTVIALY